MARKRKDAKGIKQVSEIDIIMATAFGEAMETSFTSEAWSAIQEYIEKTPDLKIWKEQRKIENEARQLYRELYPEKWRAEIEEKYNLKAVRRQIKKDEKKHKKS